MPGRSSRTGFAPFRGGPLQYARSRGIAACVARLLELAQRYGERFRPDPGGALCWVAARLAPLRVTASRRVHRFAAMLASAWAKSSRRRQRPFCDRMDERTARLTCAAEDVSPLWTAFKAENLHALARKTHGQELRRPAACCSRKATPTSAPSICHRAASSCAPRIAHRGDRARPARPRPAPRSRRDCRASSPRAPSPTSSTS